MPTSDSSFENAQAADSCSKQLAVAACSCQLQFSVVTRVQLASFLLHDSTDRIAAAVGHFAVHSFVEDLNTAFSNSCFLQASPSSVLVVHV